MDREKENDDNIELDFGKLTKLFKRKKKFGEPGEQQENKNNPSSKSHSVEHSGQNEHAYSGTKSHKHSDETHPFSHKVTSHTAENSIPQAKDSSDDEIDVGKILSGIKNMFSGIKNKTPAARDSDEDSIDLNSAYNFLSKHYKVLLLVLAITVSVGIGFNIRMQSGDLGFTDDWARNSIETTMSNDISSFISRTYPNLPDQNRQALVDQELSKARDSGSYTFKTGNFQGQNINLQQQTDATSQQFKAFFQDDAGRNYMPDIDPYYWWRYAKNVIEVGNVGDEVRNGIQWDNHQYAPLGRPIAAQDTFYPKSIVFFHKFASFFGPLFGANTDLVRTLMFYPVFISALTSLIVFLITRRIAGNIAAFFAATMVGVHGSLMSRTMFGHADSDALAIFFSVLVLWLFVEAFVAKKIQMKILFGALSGLATGFYSLAWGGWWWIFDFILLSSVGTLGLFLIYYSISKTGVKNIFSTKFTAVAFHGINEKSVRKSITAIGAYFISSGIFISLFSGWVTFSQTPLTSLGFRAIKTPVLGAASPNVLRTVAELNEGTVNQAINQIGSGLFAVAVFGIILIVIRALIEAYKKDTDSNKVINDIFYAIVLSMWLAATLYSVTKGIRFVLLIIPAFSIAFGVVFGMITTYAGNWISSEFKVNSFATKAVLFFMFFMIFPGLTLNSNVVSASRNIVQNDIPLINDAWYNALTSIKENSKEDAIITSWWDFGHHFKALADRAVTFDGTTQGSPQARWVGKFFSTDNEREAVGILRMLNCGARTATDELLLIVGDDVKAYKLTDRIIRLEKDDARAALIGEGLTEEQASKILELTHCNPPESFVIASQDMIGKSGVWAHFGGWNFTKADLWASASKLPKAKAIKYMNDKYGIEEKEANDLILQMSAIKDDRQADAWISPWPGFSGGNQGCGTNGKLVQCADGLTVNLTDYNAWYPTQQGNLHPISLVYATGDGSLIEKRFENNTLPQQLSAILIPNGDSFSSVLASPELVDGMFARMFYLRGHSLKYFKLLTRETGFIGTDVWVWQVDWDGTQENILPELRPKSIVGSGDEVTLNYIGYLDDGTVFDSSITNFQSRSISNNTALSADLEYNPFTFTTGSNSVIPGFEGGVLGAHLNEEIRIAVPPSEGYLTQDHPLFNKTLNFRIKVIKIK